MIADKFAFREKHFLQPKSGNCCIGEITVLEPATDKITLSQVSIREITIPKSTTVKFGMSHFLPGIAVRNNNPIINPSLNHY
jgi:hypothetical protein